jgi:hypothetical protein
VGGEALPDLCQLLHHILRYPFSSHSLPLIIEHSWDSHLNPFWARYHHIALLGPSAMPWAIFGFTCLNPRGRRDRSRGCTHTTEFHVAFLSVPCRPGTPAYKLQVKACIHTLSCTLQLWTSPPGWGGLRRCHVSSGSGPRLLVEVSFSAAICPAAPNLASWLRWALALPCVLWLRTSPLGTGGLQHCHVSSGSRPRLPVDVGSDAVTCPAALDLASWLRWASVLSRALWLPTSPPS